MRTKLDAASQLRVVILGMGMSSALVAKMVSEVGASVFKVSPPGGDPFHETYPTYGTWLEGCRETPEADLGALLTTADVCVIGGEDFPGVAWRFDAEDLRKQNPRLIIVDIRAYAFESWRDRPSSDLLVQAVTGLTWDQCSDRPMVLAVPAPSIGAALLAVLGTWCALLQRETSGEGQTVTTSLQQGAALFWHQHWSINQGVQSRGGILPRDIQQPILRCADGKYVFLLMGVPSGLLKLYRVLGIDQEVDPNEKGNPDASRGPKNYYFDYDLVAAHVAKFDRQDLLNALRASGLPAEPVQAPGECWNEEQVVVNRVTRATAGGGEVVDTPFQIERRGEAPWARGRTGAPGGAPLEGVRILDFGSATAGPFASKVLSDLGADVIKVDSPTAGKAPRGSLHGGSCYRGKRSVLVDAKSARGKGVLDRLCASADVVHHNFRVGVAERVGIDHDALRQANPNALSLHSSAFGAVGPKAKDSGFDMVVAAYSGLQVWISGEGPLTWYRCPLVDYMTGALGAAATVMGLYEARVLGGSVAVQSSLLEASQHLMSQLVRQADGSFAGLPELDAAQTGTDTGEALYKTRDGWIAVSTRSEAATRKLFAGLDVGGAYDAFGSRAARTAAVAERILPLTSDGAIQRLSEAGIWAEKCVEDGLAALLGNPEAWESGLMVRIEEKNGAVSEACLGPLVRFSAWADRSAHLRIIPTPGEHTRAVLTDIGFTEGEIDQLAAEGAVDF